MQELLIGDVWSSLKLFTRIKWRVDALHFPMEESLVPKQHQSLSEDFTGSGRDEALDINVTFCCPSDCSDTCSGILDLCSLGLLIFRLFSDNSIYSPFVLDGPAILSSTQDLQQWQ